MIYVLLWIALAFVAASLGSDTKLGFGGILLISLIFSPLVGFIVAMVAAPADKSNKQTTDLNNSTFIEDLEKLAKLKEAGHISDEEYQSQKEKILKR